MTDDPVPSQPRPSRAGLVPSLGAAVAVVAVLAAGVWLLAGVVAPDYAWSLGLGVAWFVVVGVMVGRLARRRPALRLALRGTFVVVAVLAASGFYWTSIRDEVVDEPVVVGVAAGRVPETDGPGAASANVTERRGDVEGLAHSSRGIASVVRLPDGRRFLTLTGFRTDNGPDLRVYLVSGEVDDNGDGDGFVDLGALKGNVGDQQYAIPPGTDLDRYATVVVWCRAFTVGFARAPLPPA